MFGNVWLYFFPRDKKPNRLAAFLQWLILSEGEKEKKSFIFFFLTRNRIELATNTDKRCAWADKAIPTLNNMIQSLCCMMDFPQVAARYLKPGHVYR